MELATIVALGKHTPERAVLNHTHTQGRTQVFIKTEVPKWRLVRGFGDMLTRENLDFPVLYVCILRCFKPHKLDNNIGLNPR